MKHVILFSILFLNFTFRGTAQSNGIIDQYLSEVYKNHVMPGFSVVVVNREGVVFKSSYGFTELGGTAAFSSKTVNPIGSLTKSITALAILQLVEQNKLSLDVPVKHYLPEFTTANPARSDNVTVRMLLDNTSGLVGHTRSTFDMSEKSVQTMIKNLSNTFILTKPGTVYQYSNIGFSVAGLLVSTVSGQPYHKYVKSNVLQPLAMINSSMLSENKKGLAIGHYPGIGKAIADRSDGMLSGEFIAAGQYAVSTTDDLANYLMMYLNKGIFHSKRILSKSLMEEMWDPEIDFVGMSVRDGGGGDRYQYGLGWMISTIDGRKVYHHGGSTGTASSFTMIDPENGLAVSLLTNVDLTLIDRHRYPFGLHVVNNILHLAAGHPTTGFALPTEKDQTKNNYQLPKSKYGSYVGRYEFKAGGDNFVYYDRPYLLITEEFNELKGAIYRDDQIINEFLFDFVSPSSAISRNIANPSNLQFQINDRGRVVGVFAFGMELGKMNSTSETWRKCQFEYFEFSVPPYWIETATENGFKLSTPGYPDVKLELLRSGKIPYTNRIGSQSTLRRNRIQWEKQTFFMSKGSDKLVTIFSRETSHGLFHVKFTSKAISHTYLLQYEVLPFLENIWMTDHGL